MFLVNVGPNNTIFLGTFGREREGDKRNKSVCVRQVAKEVRAWEEDEIYAHD